MDLCGLRFEKAVAKLWLVVGAVGALVFVIMLLCHASRLALETWAAIGVTHWAGGVFIHAFLSDHIWVIDEDQWEKTLLWLFGVGLYACVALFVLARMAGLSGTDEGVPLAGVYVFTTMLLALKAKRAGYLPG